MRCGERLLKVHCDDEGTIIGLCSSFVGPERLLRSFSLSLVQNDARIRVRGTEVPSVADRACVLQRHPEGYVIFKVEYMAVKVLVYRYLSIFAAPPHVLTIESFEGADGRDIPPVRCGMSTVMGNISREALYVTADVAATFVRDAMGAICVSAPAITRRGNCEHRCSSNGTSWYTQTKVKGTLINTISRMALSISWKLSSTQLQAVTIELREIYGILKQIMKQVTKTAIWENRDLNIKWKKKCQAKWKGYRAHCLGTDTGFHSMNKLSLCRRSGKSILHFF